MAALHPVPPLFFLGGSPCSGKSTAAELLAQKMGWRWLPVDPLAERLIEKAFKITRSLYQKREQVIFLKGPLSLPRGALRQKNLSDKFFQRIPVSTLKNGGTPAIIGLQTNLYGRG